jgi:hypothetical protein
VNLPPDEPTAVPGKKYAANEFRKFRTRVKQFPDIMQPGHVRLFNVPVFVSVHDGRLELNIFDQDNRYVVTDRSIDGARVVEAAIAPLASSLIEPPLDDKHCICPKYYPEFWRAGAL